MRKNTLKKMLLNISKSTKIFVIKQTDIALRISEILSDKNMKNKDLASLLGVTESRISKILAGNENLTLKTIANIESALDSEIITVNYSINQNQFAMVGTSTDYTQNIFNQPVVWKSYKFVNLNIKGDTLLVSNMIATSQDTPLIGEVH